MVAGGREDRAFVAVGKIGGSYGSDGGLSLTLYDDFPNTVDMEEPVFVEIDEHAVPLFFDSFKRRGRRGATVSFADIDTDVRAAELVGLEIHTEGGAEFAGAGGAGFDGVGFANFVGWTADLREVSGGVSEASGEALTGEIAGFIGGANPLFEVELPGCGQVLIPIALAVEADEVARKMTFELPEGLLTIND